jgi:hypothetical protein
MEQREDKIGHKGHCQTHSQRDCGDHYKSNARGRGREDHQIMAIKKYCTFCDYLGVSVGENARLRESWN